MLREHPRGIIPDAFTSDGRLIFSAHKPDTNDFDLFQMALEGDRQAELIVGGPYSESQAALSPDERWLAYVSNEGGRANVYVRPYAAKEGRWQISATRGAEPRWGRDGRELFFREGATLFRVAVDTARGFTVGRPERLFDRVASGGQTRSYAPSPSDDRIFTYRSPEGRGDLRTLHLEIGFAARVAAQAAKP